MDEPLSNLDAKLRLHMRGELKRFQRDLGTTSIYVTHDQAEAMTLADRVAIMNRGVLQQVGPPKEVYRNPANMFVAGFLGSPPMNFFELSMRQENGEAVLTGPTTRYRIPASWLPELRARQDARVVLGVRPEHVTISRTATNGGLQAEVYVVEDLGNEMLVDLRVDGQSAVARVAGGDAPEIGDRVWLTFPAEQAHLFDPGTELHIVKRG
jgi:multiple sugar transport system ATP-binding protein